MWAKGGITSDVHRGVGFLHLGLVSLNGVERMQTNAFVRRDKKPFSQLRARFSDTVTIVSPPLLLVTLLVEV